MAKSSARYEMDMCNGPLLKKLLTFSLPLVLTGVLQLFYNAADIVVVGRFAGAEALAAVGSTGALINLLVNVFMGLSVGASVVVAQQYGANDRAGVSDTVHTSMLVALVCGVGVGVFGYFMAAPMLEWMGTPDDVIQQAALYVRIYFVGMPVNMLYNFGGAVLRAVGDTKRPLFFLTVSGIINVVLNLFFVIAFGMGVAGVAWATIISQAVSAVLVIRCLMRTDSCIRLIPRQLRIHKQPLLRIARIGLPAGLQGSIFSISNVLIQSAVNSFGSVVMAGNAAASNLEGFIYTSMNSIYQACMTFTGQNMGAQKYRRARRVLPVCLGIVTVIGAAMGGVFLLLGPQLISIYNTDPQVIEMGMQRLVVICSTYYFCGMMDVLVGQMRGMGYSVIPMIVSLTGACGFRVLWIYTIFAANPTLRTLYISYPVSWVITAGCHLLCYLLIQRKYPKTDLA